MRLTSRADESGHSDPAARLRPSLTEKGTLGQIYARVYIDSRLLFSMSAIASSQRRRSPKGLAVRQLKAVRKLEFRTSRQFGPYQLWAKDI